MFKSYNFHEHFSPANPLLQSHLSKYELMIFLHFPFEEQLEAESQGIDYCKALFSFIRLSFFPVSRTGRSPEV